MNASEALQSVLQGYRMPNPADDRRITCPSELYKMMLRCWEAEPNERPSFADLHAFFNNFYADLDTEYTLDDAE